MGPYGSPASSSSASTPLFATPSHFNNSSSNYNPHRSYYFNGTQDGSSSSNNDDPNFKQRRRNVRGRNGIFGASLGSSPTLALVPTLLRAVLLSPLLVLVLYLTFRSKGGSSGNQQQQRYYAAMVAGRNSPAMAKASYNNGAPKTSTATNLYNDCMRSATHYEHGALQRDACRRQAMQQAASSSSTYSSATDANYTEGDATVLILPPPPIQQQQQQQQLQLVQQDEEGSGPMATSTYLTSGSTSVLDATTNTIVRPRPQPKRAVANYYNPMMEATAEGAQAQQGEELVPLAPVQMQQMQLQQQQQQPNSQRVIVQPSHLKNAQPMQILTSSGGSSAVDGTTLLLVQQEEALQEPSPPMLLSSESQEQLLVPSLQRPPIPLPSTGAVDGLELPAAEMPVPAAQSRWRKSRNRKNAAGNVDANAAAAAVAYYYYDPRQVRMDSRSGQVVLPEIVYDSSGKPHLLANLRARQVWVDTAAASAASPPRQSATANVASPPMGIASSTNVAAASAAAPANLVGSAAATTTTTTTATMVDSNMKTATGLPQWGESTATDQSIIVCTVGLMALLVGAVSARRFRRQSILSACIENEALDSNHDYSYDNTGYGSGTHPYGAPGGPSSSYKTFEGWKGDLEKFDV